MTNPSITNCAIFGLGCAAAAMCTLAVASAQGVPPRRSASDYPVHQSAKTAVIAATVVPPDQVRKMFSSNIGDHYVVVEVAIYPEDGKSFEADSYDFALKTGGKIAHADSPADAVLPWGERKDPVDNKGVHVTEEAGVAVARTNDPYYGKRTSVGTYEGTTVSNGPPPPQPQSGPDPRAVEWKLREKALPEGRAAQPVAGYLYFPQYQKKHKGDAVELQYTKQDVEADLRFPAK